MNIAKIFVFAALLVIAVASMPGSSPIFAEFYNAPQQGEPYGKAGEDSTAFNGKVQDSKPCMYSTYDPTAFHNGPRDPPVN